MPDTAEQTQLKAMTAAATEPLLSDLEIDNLLTQFSIVDADGYDPTEVAWTPTYNLRAATLILAVRPALVRGFYRGVIR